MSENFDRSKFKAAKLSKLRETKEDAKKNDVRLLGGGDNGGRANFHAVDEGSNEFRLMPPHDYSKTGSYVPCRTATLECDVPEFKEGKETGKFEKKNKKIFIATQHGNETLRKLGKDPIELYIKYFGEGAGLIDDKDDRTSFLAPIKGWRSKDGKWNWGIMPSTTYICYALKDSKLGRLELWDKWTKDMDKIVASIEEEEKTVLEADPFSDPDEGYPLVIKKEKNDKGKWEYTVERRNPKKRQSWDEFCEENRITDAQLKELYEKESLYDLYVDCYTKRDFDLAVNGLQNFDKKWKRSIFENEDFLAELKEIEAIVPEPKTKDSDIDETFESAKNETDTSKWPKPKCKKMLKAYIMDAYASTPEESDYLDALEKLDDLETLRKWAALADSGEELPELEQVEEQDVEVPEDVEVEEENTEEQELENITRHRRRS